MKKCSLCIPHNKDLADWKMLWKSNTYPHTGFSVHPSKHGWLLLRSAQSVRYWETGASRCRVPYNLKKMTWSVSLNPREWVNQTLNSTQVSTGSQFYLQSTHYKRGEFQQSRCYAELSKNQCKRAYQAWNHVPTDCNSALHPLRCESAFRLRRLSLVLTWTSCSLQFSLESHKSALTGSFYSPFQHEPISHAPIKDKTDTIIVDQTSGPWH